MRIEDRLNGIGNDIRNMHAPDEMEQALRSALENRPGRQGARANQGFVRRHRASLAAAILLLAFLFYSYDAMAYYVRKLGHYDGIVTGSLKKLESEGQGQDLGVSATFGDGAVITLDRLLFDDNQCVFLYRMEGPNVSFDDGLPMFRLEGIFGDPLGYPPESGMASMPDEHSIVGMQTFVPPAFFEKWMKLKVSKMINGRYEEQVIPFTLVRNRAMFKTVHQNIDASVELDGCTIHFDAISASPLSTKVKGRIDGWIDMDPRGNNLTAKHLVFDIAADGKAVTRQGSGLSSGTDGAEFDNDFDALPEGFGSVRIENIRFETLKMIDSETDITPLVNQPATGIELGDDLVLKEVRQSGDRISVTVESTGLPVAALMADGEQLTLVNEDELQASDAPIKTFIFEGSGTDLKFMVKCIRYVEESDAVIQIQ